MMFLRAMSLAGFILSGPAPEPLPPPSAAPVASGCPADLTTTDRAMARYRIS